MKRRLLIGFGISLPVILGLLVLYMWMAVNPSVVTVTIKNQSGKPISMIRLEHEDGFEVLENLAAGQSKKMRFHALGESSYELRVVFTDSSEITGGCGYVQNGYKVSETISDSAIKSEYEGLY